MQAKCEAERAKRQILRCALMKIRSRPRACSLLLALCPSPGAGGKLPLHLIQRHRLLTILNRDRLT